MGELPKTQHKQLDPDLVRQRMAAFGRHLLVGRGLAPYTISGYTRVAAKAIRDLGTFKPNYEQIEEYIVEFHMKQYSFNHIVNTSLAIERYMEFIGSPIKLGRPKKPKRIIKDVLSEAEIAVLLAACKNTRERATLAILAYSGIRSKELCALRVRDIDFGHNTLTILGGKGAKERIICISGECTSLVLQYLQEYPRDKPEYLITTLAEGKQYRGWALRKMVQTVAARVGMEDRVYPHLFRHSLATNMIQRGASLITVKEQLGHAFIETTMVYITSRIQRVQAEYQMFAPSYL